MVIKESKYVSNDFGFIVYNRKTNTQNNFVLRLGVGWGVGVGVGVGGGGGGWGGVGGGMGGRCHLKYGITSVCLAFTAGWLNSIKMA